MNRPPKNNSKISNKFLNTPSPTGTRPNAIKYVNKILANDSITNIPACKDMYDDNYGVRALGYSSCNNAYADYIAKGLDSAKLYGQTKSLNDFCPITTKNPIYMDCMATLLNKFNINANIFQNVNSAMSDSINKRIQDRSDILNDIQLDTASYISSKDVMNFKAQTGLLDDINKSSDQKLYESSIYYKGKYANFSRSGFNSNINDNSSSLSSSNIIESFYSNTKSIINVDPYIVTNFFGNYIPVKGQFLAFNNIIVSLNFDEYRTSDNDESISIENPFAINDGISKNTVPITTASMENKNPNSGSVSLTITNNATNGSIIYNVNGIGNHEGKKNAIALDISSQTINTYNVGDDQALQQLLMVLGINIPSKLIITIKQVTSDSGKMRWSYTLMNINMDTIMVMKKKN